MKNFFTSNITYTDNASYRRVIMINSILSLAVMVFFLFTYMNILMGKEFIALLDFLTAIASIITLFSLRKNHSVQRAAVITTLILMLFMFIFIYTNKNSHFGIIWSIFIPFFSILFNGKKLGLIFSIFYYIVMFSLAYIGIGVWNEGAWDILDFTRFAISGLILTYILYVSESAFEDSNTELKLVREHEQEMLGELQQQAITDGLTGMYNRRHFNDVVPSLINTAHRKNEYISFFILDVDYFKFYNDYYGHQKGDIALKEIATTLMNFTTRDNDIVFRLGGEEFAGLIQSNRPQKMKEWLQALTNTIESLHIEHKATLVQSDYLTISVGVYTLNVEENMTMNAMYKEADKALYRAKEEGRNRVVFT